MDIYGMLKLCFSTLGTAIFIPVYNTAFIVFLVILYTQYKKLISYQEIVYGKPKMSFKNIMFSSILSSLLAGIFISLIMIFLGITFNENMGISYLIYTSLILMIFDTRFICFSYSGGIISIIGLVFGIKEIDVTSIMLLVGILHLLEAILIYFDGYRGAIPVFLQKEDGSIAGGFTMKRFWPIPIALIVFTGFGTIEGASVSTPDWWPLIKPYIDTSKINEAIFMALPISAMLGYSEFTSSYIPKEKCKKTSLRLALFSIILLVIGYVSTYIYIFKYIAALFAPLAHEGLIKYENWAEKNRKSIFVSSREGVRVLDTLPDSPAEKMGIMPGDTIISINNRTVVTEQGIEEFFKSFITYIWVEVKDLKGKIKTFEYKNYSEGIDNIGIISVPLNTNGLVTEKYPSSILKRLLRKLKK